MALRVLAVLLALLASWQLCVDEARAEHEAKATVARCPVEMAAIDSFCIDRWEASMVDRNTGQPLSPYYPPEPRRLGSVYRLWQVERHTTGDLAAQGIPLPPLPEVQRHGRFSPRAVSVPNVVPQGYLTFATAQLACKNAGKRLCSEQEWVTACRGSRGTKFPYGPSYSPGACNVYRYYHPAFLLHGYSWLGHSDPRLNLVYERGVDPVLRSTGATPTCESQWSDGNIYDMVGNLDEWIDDPAGVFVGGFYARATKEGCESRISSHSPLYYDYSLGTRCCKSQQ